MILAIAISMMFIGLIIMIVSGAELCFGLISRTRGCKCDIYGAGYYLNSKCKVHNK
jgi:hypothetical protein